MLIGMSFAKSVLGKVSASQCNSSISRVRPIIGFKTGTILDNFNFTGYLVRLIEILNSSERTGAMMSIEHFSNFVREEYKPCDLSLAKDNIPVFTQSYVIG